VHGSLVGTFEIPRVRSSVAIGARGYRVSVAETKYPIPGAFVGSMLVSGEVDLAVQSIPELNFVKGVDLVGALPSDLQATTNYAVAISASAKQPDAARTLIFVLQSPKRSLSSRRKASTLGNELE
jgi:ABC-type molybdate transport system substrate-binding protein